MEIEALKAAHKHSFQHRDELDHSVAAGCFFCETSFPASSVQEWTDDGQTAICPNCGIDSVIGDASGLNVTDSIFLDAMNAYWFGGSARMEVGNG